MQSSGGILLEVELIDHGDGHFRLVVLPRKQEKPTHISRGPSQPEQPQITDEEKHEVIS